MNLHPTSLTLLEGLKNGENIAWKRFEGLYEGRVRCQLSKVLSNPADVDEVYQDVLLALHDRIGSFDRRREGSFRKFLRIICYRTARDRIERNNRHHPHPINPQVAPLFDIEQLADQESDLSLLWEEEHLQFQTEVVLEELRRRCGDRKTDIFLELGREELSREEIAGLFQISMATLFRIQAEVRRAVSEIQKDFGDILDFFPEK